VSASENRERRISGGRAAFDQALIVCGKELTRSVGKADGVGPRRSVEAMVRAARQANMPPERTLAAFKKLLRTLPEIERLPLDDRSETTRQLVQLAIDAYYDDKE
jgi:hypothetical protein